MNDNEAVAALAALDTPEAPELPETPELPAETPEAPVETPGETPETPESPTQTPELPAETPTETTTDDIDWAQFLQSPADVPEPTPDDEGNVDFRELARYEANQALRQQADEIRGWQAATKVFPDIAKNPQLRDFVSNQRIANVATGGTGDLVEAAKAVKELFGQATAEGKSQATASITVQSAAALETGTPTPPAPTKTFNPDDPTEVQDLLATWIDQGAI